MMPYNVKILSASNVALQFRGLSAAHPNRSSSYGIAFALRIQGLLEEVLAKWQEFRSSYTLTTMPQLSIFTELFALPFAADVPIYKKSNTPRVTN